MPQHVRADDVSRWRRNTATILLGFAAVGAVLSFVMAAASALPPGGEITIATTWQMFGFLVFAGLFALLAYRPQQYPGVWELVIFHKAATAIFLTLFASNVPGATVTIAVDTILTVVLIAAYLLVRGYASWGHRRGAIGTSPS